MFVRCMFQCISYDQVGNSQELHLAVCHSICGEISSIERFQASELERHLSPATVENIHEVYRQ